MSLRLMPKHVPPAWAPIVILISLGLLWGGVTNVARFVGLSGIPPLAYAFWTLIIGAGLLTLVNLVRRKQFPSSPRHLRYYLVAGALSSGLPTANMFWCLNYISVGVMSLALTMVPLATYLLAVVFGLEKPQIKRASGIGLGLLGALLVILPDNGLPADQPVGWFMMAFFTPAAYAAGSVYTAKYKPADVESLVGANGMMLASALLLLCLMLIAGQWYALWEDFTLVNGLITLHGVVSAIAFTLFFTLIRIAGPVYFSQVGYLVTVFGIAIALVVFGERYSVWHWLALGVTIYGVWLVNSAQRQTGHVVSKA